ncbi:MAG: DUF4340 domain-containing protein [Planctomycetes bacterium]|nr:DUF4340 domain-containing protein [Planctomycetota bacterium]
MKNKQIIIALSVFCVLLIVYFVVIKRPEKSSVVAGYQSLCGNFSAAGIKRVELYRGADKQQGITLSKDNDNWIVESSFHVPGDAEKIQKIFSAVSTAEGKVRATGKEFFSNFDLTEEKALNIILSGDSSSFHILIGKRGAESQETFARMADSENVLSIDQDIRGEIGVWGDQPLKQEDWIQRKFLQLEKDQIQKISYRHNGKDFLFVKEEKKADGEEKSGENKEAEGKKEYEWKLTANDGVFDIKKAKANDILAAAVSLRIEKAVDPKEYTDDIFNTSDTNVQFTMADTTIHTIHFAYKKDGIYVKKEGNSAVYKISSYEKSKIAPNAGEFLEIALPKIKELERFKVVDYRIDAEWARKQELLKEIKEGENTIKIAYALVDEKTWVCFDNNPVVFQFEKSLYETLNEKEEVGEKEE